MSNLLPAMRAPALFCLLWVSCPLIAQQQTPAPENQEQRDQDARARLHDLQEMIIEKNRDKADLEARVLAQPKDEATAEQLEELVNQIASLEEDFESIATGGRKIDGFYAEEEETLDWQGDLLDIAKPLFDSLKELSERPRQIEQHRTTVTRYTERLEETEAALNTIARLKTGLNEMGPNTQRNFLELEQAWLQHHEDIERDLGVARFKLNELMDDKSSVVDLLSQGAASFFKGRGRNLILAALVATLLILLMRAFTRTMMRMTHTSEEKSQKVSLRVVLYSLHLLTGVVALGGVLFTLYAVGDWILLGLAVIILIGVALRLKDWVPQFLSELRLLLNLGSVREGERVIYNGLPWKVASLNLYSKLVNPALRGGELRLSLDRIATLTSRPEGESEPWFPCKEGDWLFFDNGIHCKVMLQTPEVVHVRTAGGTIHIWETQQFLTMKPMNFSMGSYGVIFNFGIDIRHWDICTEEEIRRVLEQSIRDKFSGRRAGECLKHILIEFKEPSLNALNFLVRVDMDSDIDDDYYHVKRLANAACVEACRKRGWTLPVNMIAMTNPEAQPA